MIRRITLVNLLYLYSHLGILNACFGIRNITVRTRSGLGNDNGNRQPKPYVIQCAPKAVSNVEHATMAMRIALLEK